jgi:hypothetical protein
MKSGTTYLSRLLGAHPEIFICSPREPCYFGNPDELRRVWPQAWNTGIWRSEREYLQLFATAGRAKYIGEASTTYSKAPTMCSVAQQISTYSPDARIVYVMRDPVERTISHYWHMVRWHFEYRGPLAAVRSDPYYASVSHYAFQLAPYVSSFGARNIFTLTYERLISEPVREMQALYAWLGVDATFVPPDVTEAVNVTPDVIDQARLFGLLKRFSQSTAWSVAAPYVTKKVRTRLAAAAVRRVRPAQTSTHALIEYLRPLQRAQTDELSRLLGRTFPEWRLLGD